MMRFDEKSGNFYVTDLGRVASHFYIQYTSVETYNNMLKRHMNESEVRKLTSNSQKTVIECSFSEEIAFFVFLK